MVPPTNLELYTQFIPDILSDVAKRRTDSGDYLPPGRRRWIATNGQRRRVFVHADHICYQQEQFRDSDSEFRLAMAVAAAERIEKARLGGTWGSNTKVCLLVAETLLNSGCERLKRRFLRSSQRTRTQSQACTLHTLSEPPFVEMADTIRRQVSRYRRRHADWRRDFDFRVSLFQSSRFRDLEWFRQTEEGYVRWLCDFEKRQEFEWFEAMKLVAMAHFYQEQHKFDQAAAVYRMAILSARKALMDEGLRRVVLHWLRASVKACVQETRSLPDPAYSDRRTPIQSDGCEVSRCV